MPPPPVAPNGPINKSSAPVTALQEETTATAPSAVVTASETRNLDMAASKAFIPAMSKIVCDLDRDRRKIVVYHFGGGKGDLLAPACSMRALVRNTRTMLDNVHREDGGSPSNRVYFSITVVI